MKNVDLLKDLSGRLESLKKEGLYKEEYLIETEQKVGIHVKGKGDLLNFCANNYLGLANNKDIVKASKDMMDRYGYGMASVRFICGTQDIHKELESRISSFLGTEDTILYGSCFDANGGLFETILGEEDAVISDELNHASIIDGVRLCKAKRYRYKNNNMEDLEAQLKQAEKDGARYKLVATDGVFSMDGIIANLNGVCDLAEKYGALVLVDDSHATGFLGKKGRGSHEYCNVASRVDILTGTLGKALGGGSGGYTSGKKEIVQWLRQRSRPYLFSNSITPSVVGAALKTLDILEKDGETLRGKLWENAAYYRKKMTDSGFTLAGKDHAIIPVMLGDAKIASEFSKKLLEKGVYAIAFSYPVVPIGKARIRTQMSAAHTKEQIDFVVDAFVEIGKDIGVLK